MEVLWNLDTIKPRKKVLSSLWMVKLLPPMAKTEENMGSLFLRDDKLSKSLLENTEAGCWIYANKMKPVEIKGNFKKS